MSEHICPDVQSALTDVVTKGFCSRREYEVRGEDSWLSSCRCDPKGERASTTRADTANANSKAIQTETGRNQVHHTMAHPVRLEQMPSSGRPRDLVRAYLCRATSHGTAGQGSPAQALQPQLIQHTCSDSATCQLWQMGSSPLHMGQSYFCRWSSLKPSSSRSLRGHRLLVSRLTGPGGEET